MGGAAQAGVIASTGGRSVIAVAVGIAGVIVRSTDGIAWSTSGITGGPGGGQTLQDVCYSPELGLFVAVGNGGGVYTSPDGLTWTSQSAGSSTYTSVAWSPALGLFVAVGGAGLVRTSPDGITWTLRTPGVFSGIQINHVEWSPDLAKFLAVGQGAIGATSADGSTWTTVSGTGLNLKATAWSPSQALFACVANVTSATGIRTWPGSGAFVSRTCSLASAQVAGGIAWSPDLGLFAAVFQGGGIATSPDGITWTPRTSGTSNSLWGGVWSAALGMFLFGEASTSTIRYSSDGVNWNAGTGAAATYYAVAVNG